MASAADDLSSDLEGIDPETFRAAVEVQSQIRLAAFAEGVTRYRDFVRPARPPEPQVLWTEGSTRLLDYGAVSTTSRQSRTILFVPSLINRSYILDLTAKRSLMRDLAGRGYRPLLVDWGKPGRLESGFTLDDYISGRLVRALKTAHEESGRQVALAGYCMGGLLALALAGLQQELVSSLVLMATPWDFHAMDSGKTRMLEAMTPSIETLLEATACLPVDVLQAMFASLDPYLTANKFRAFAQWDMKSDKAKAFVALEDWLNDGVPLAGPTARECLIGWYVENRPGLGEWKISGKPVLPERINIPSLLVVPMDDHIVPPESALPLAEKLPDSKCLKIKTGHIGMVAGSRARSLLYSPLAKWLDSV